MASGPVNLRAYAKLLRSNSNFRRLWIAQLVSEIGDWLYSVAIYSLVLELTNSAQAVAFAFVLQVLPQTLAAPTAGVLNDRLSRKRLMIFANCTSAVFTFLMLFAQSREALPLLYLLLFLETLFWTLFEPAHTAVIPNMTRDDDETLVANALSSTTWAFSLAAGAAVGGLIATLFGRNTVFVLNSLSFLVAAILIRRIRIEEPHLKEVPPFRWRDLAGVEPVIEGFRYVRSDPRLFATLFIKGGMSLTSTNWVLLPLLAQKVYPVQIPGWDSSPELLGMSLLFAARGVGALIGPFIFTRFTGNSPAQYRKGILVAFAVCSAGYLLIGTSPVLIGAVAGVVIAHCGSAASWVFSTTLLQLQTEDRFRGRVFAAELALNMAAMAAVVQGGGYLLDHGMPPQHLALATGAAILLPAAFWAVAQRLWRDTPLPTQILP